MLLMLEVLCALRNPLRVLWVLRRKLEACAFLPVILSPLIGYAWLLRHSHFPNSVLGTQRRKQWWKLGIQSVNILRSGKRMFAKILPAYTVVPRTLTSVTPLNWMTGSFKSPSQLSHEDGGTTLSSGRPSWVLHKLYLLKTCGVKSSDIKTLLDWRYPYWPRKFEAFLFPDGLITFVIVVIKHLKGKPCVL